MLSSKHLAKPVRKTWKNQPASSLGKAIKLRLSNVVIPTKLLTTMIPFYPCHRRMVGSLSIEPFQNRLSHKVYGMATKQKKNLR
ncbi:unnamed protein product [Adineta ricciae]|uniref:Ribosomal protein S19 n=1 Tax=Adineta ricciae TaxID=249248 RepID=A0A814LQN4_ADIRI|nr:unnamed protein product [Adineta ricciae]